VVKLKNPPTATTIIVPRAMLYNREADGGNSRAKKNDNQQASRVKNGNPGERGREVYEY